MYTSANHWWAIRLLRQLGVTIFFAIFGAVYEIFSHEVYSYYMIYAFAIPLVLGVLPYAIILAVSLKRQRTVIRQSERSEAHVRSSNRPANASICSAALRDPSANPPTHPSVTSDRLRSGSRPKKNALHRAVSFWTAGIMTLTVGCTFQGVLEIFGTTNHLIYLYLIVGGALLLAGLLTACFFRSSFQRLYK